MCRLWNSCFWKAESAGQDAFLELLEYWNTAISDLEYAPAQLLMSRKLKSSLPMIGALRKPKVVKHAWENLLWQRVQAFVCITTWRCHSCAQRPWMGTCCYCRPTWNSMVLHHGNPRLQRTLCNCLYLSVIVEQPVNIYGPMEEPPYSCSTHQRDCSFFIRLSSQAVSHYSITKYLCDTITWWVEIHKEWPIFEDTSSLQ